MARIEAQDDELSSSFEYMAFAALLAKTREEAVDTAAHSALIAAAGSRTTRRKCRRLTLSPAGC